LIWIEKAFYTGKSSLLASEDLDTLTWDCFRVTFSTFLQKFEIATTRELGLSDEGRKIKLWKKLPNALCNALQIHFDSVDYYGLVRLITDHENLKFSVTANNNFVGPTSVASVANLESSDVNAMDHTSNRTDRDRGPRKFNDKKNIRCFKCRKPGHIAADCRSEQYCNYCDRNGHLDADCRSKKRDQQSDKRWRDNNNNSHSRNDNPRDNDNRSKDRKQSSRN
jgi:hypothetical protein